MHLSRLLQMRSFQAKTDGALTEGIYSHTASSLHAISQRKSALSIINLWMILEPPFFSYTQIPTVVIRFQSLISATCHKGK